MTNYYRINVSRNGMYLFATEQGGITSRGHADEVLGLFLEKFPKEQGYNVTMTYWKSKGETIYE